MRWSEPYVAGFLLAATLVGDRGARKAAAGLAPIALGQLGSAAEALDALDSASRKRRVATLAARFREPVRARDNRTPRPGYAPEPSLARLVRRIAASHDAP